MTTPPEQHPLRYYRIRAGLSQMALSLEAGVSIPVIRKAEQETGGLSELSKGRICAALGIEIEQVRWPQGKRR